MICGPYVLPILVNTVVTPTEAGTLMDASTGSVTVSPIYRPSERIIWSLRYNFRTQKSKYDNIGNSLDKFNEEGQNTNLKRYYDGASPDDLWAVRSAGIGIFVE